MTTLRDIQEGMQDYVLKNDLSVSDEIIKPDNMEVAGRLDVYRNAYYLRLIEILEDDFSVLSTVIGEDAFDSMIRDYLDAFPSHHFSVRTVGRHLVKFLKNTEGCHPAYAELAEFEWAIVQASFAKDAELLTMETLAKIPHEEWASMTLTLHPSVQIVKCAYNTMERWQSVNEELGDIDAEQLAEPRYHLIWQRDNEAYYCALEAEQSYLIHAIGKGENFGDLCETMLSHFSEEEVVQWVASTFQTWVAEGVFTVQSSDPE